MKRVKHHTHTHTLSAHRASFTVSQLTRLHLNVETKDKSVFVPTRRFVSRSSEQEPFEQRPLVRRVVLWGSGGRCVLYSHAGLGGGRAFLSLPRAGWGERPTQYLEC